MTTAYRKNFILLSMIMVESVLLVVLLLIGIYVGISRKNELMNAMRMALSPFDVLNEADFTPGYVPPGPKPGSPYENEDPDDGDADGDNDTDDWDELPAENPYGRRGRAIIDLRNEDREVTSLMAASDGSNVRVIVNRLSIDDEELEAAAKDVINAAKNSGILRTRRLLYYKEEAMGGIRIALMPASTLYTDVLRLTLILLAVFIAASALFYLVSRRLSRLAARPMEQAVEMERRFVADISHDLKTPITVIKANNSILRSTPDSTVREQSQWIEGTENAADHMLGMIDEMLTLSSLDSVAARPELKPVSFSEAVTKAVIQLESVAYEHGILLNDRIEENVCVAATEDYLDRIASGLIENALKYGADGSTVNVSLTQRKKTVVFTVQNTGSVIAAEDLPHVFERFYRGDKTRGDKQGHGLGLSIIHRITELIGAEISVKSDPEIGTIFTVTANAGE